MLVSRDLLKKDPQTHKPKTTGIINQILTADQKVLQNLPSVEVYGEFC